MTTLKMLRLLDSTYQTNMALYHLDGTYRINNFQFSIYSRTDMNRKFFLIDFVILSSEKNKMLVTFFIALQNWANFFGINFDCHYTVVILKRERTRDS